MLKRLERHEMKGNRDGRTIGEQKKVNKLCAGELPSQEKIKTTKNRMHALRYRPFISNHLFGTLRTYYIAMWLKNRNLIVRNEK